MSVRRHRGARAGDACGGRPLRRTRSAGVAARTGHLDGQSSQTRRPRCSARPGRICGRGRGKDGNGTRSSAAAARPGAGGGRLVAAGRRVLVLEAGPDYGACASGRWPRDAARLGDHPRVARLGLQGRAELPGREPALRAARVIGGCSAHNGCTVSWGHRAGYDAWNCPAGRATSCCRCSSVRRGGCASGRFADDGADADPPRLHRGRRSPLGPAAWSTTSTTWTACPASARAVELAGRRPLERGPRLPRPGARPPGAEGPGHGTVDRVLVERRPRGRCAGDRSTAGVRGAGRHVVLAAGPTARRRCCCARASGRPTICASWASTWSRQRPASAPASTTTRRSSCSTPPRPAGAAQRSVRRRRDAVAGRAGLRQGASSLSERRVRPAHLHGARGGRRPSIYIAYVDPARAAASASPAATVGAAA